MGNTNTEDDVVIMLKPRPQVRAFSNLMEATLQNNDHKGGWKDINIAELFRRAQEKLDELRDAIVSGKKPDIAAKSCDAANYLMMLLDNAVDRDELTDEDKKVMPSHRQLSIAFGKHLVGFEQGQEGWCKLDDEALHYAYYGDETTPLPFDDDNEEEHS